MEAGEGERTGGSRAQRMEERMPERGGEHRSRKEETEERGRKAQKTGHVEPTACKLPGLYYSPQD